MKYDGYTKYDAEVAAGYDRDRSGEEHWQAENLFVERYAATHALGRVLDLPVGTGRFLHALINARSPVGLDVSAPMLGEAKRAEGRERVSFVLGDALRLPFADRSFDTILCFRLVHLLPPELVRSLFAELTRVARGRIVVQIYAAPDRQPRFRAVTRVMARLFALLPRRRTPWSHIQSFPHTTAFIEAEVARAQCRIARRTVLAQYHGSSVEVLELER